MSNDNRINSRTTSLHLNTNIRTSEKSNLKYKLKKILLYLKPTIFNTFLSFISFLMLLFFSQNVWLALGLGVLSYFIFSLLLFFIQANKIGDHLNIPFLKNANESLSFIETTSNKIIVLSQDKTVFAIALMKLEWPSSYISINSLINFLEEEGIQIQDCREGCLLVFRKNATLSSTKDKSEQVIKLVKEIEKTILLTKKKFELEYDTIQLSVIKGKENILAILNLGLFPHRFNHRDELSEEDFETLRNNSFEVGSEHLLNNLR